MSNASASHAECLVDWPALNVLADQLDEASRRRAFRGLGPIPVSGTTSSMDAEVVARIILADIDHVREWERAHPDEGSDLRREELALEVKFLLLYIDLPRNSDTG
jgi:hypothetical protein